MKHSCFKQIKLCLHFNDNKEEEGSNGYLFKVRPLLNALKTTLGLYLNVGEKGALDESSIACRSKYGCSLIFYNPTKPGDGFYPNSEGKYHGNAVNNDNESDDGSVDNNDKDDNIDEHNPNTDQTASKTTSLILDMMITKDCKQYKRGSYKVAVNKKYGLPSYGTRST
eukprot:4371181-Ditylum_brightwellii.AAC.1